MQTVPSRYATGDGLAAYYRPVSDVLRQRPTEPHEIVDAVYVVANFPRLI